MTEREGEAGEDRGSIRVLTKRRSDDEGRGQGACAKPITCAPSLYILEPFIHNGGKSTTGSTETELRAEIYAQWAYDVCFIRKI